MDIFRRGRLETAPAGDVARFLSSMDADAWIFEADILVDKAHVVMLAEQGIISPSEGREILRGLETIKREGFQRLDRGLEDIHLAIETRLTSLVGEVAGRMHTGRSRNDEVATCIRLALRDRLLELAGEVLNFQDAFLRVASLYTETLLPGFTHTQHGQPTTLAHHLLAHEGALERDLRRLKSAYENTNQSPLGAAAFAGTGFPIDRRRQMELLGFRGLVENTMDAVSTRDFIIEALAACSNLMVDLGRFAEEMILWSTQEFGFVEMDDRYASTSSIMPQKKNPDVAELIRGKVGGVHGCLFAVLEICKALPYSYNRDIQEATPHLWRGVSETLRCTRMARGILETLKFNTGRMEAAASWGFTTATELADTLVRETGIPFREAHQVIARASRTSGLTLEDIENTGREVLGKSLENLGLTRDAVELALDPLENIRRRDLPGGPAPSQTRKYIKEKQLSNKEGRVWLENEKERIKKAIQLLEEAASKL